MLKRLFVLKFILLHLYIQGGINYVVVGVFENEMFHYLKKYFNLNLRNIFCYFLLTIKIEKQLRHGVSYRSGSLKRKCCGILQTIELFS